MPSIINLMDNSQKSCPDQNDVYSASKIFAKEISPLKIDFKSSSKKSVEESFSEFEKEQESLNNSLKVSSPPQVGDADISKKFEIKQNSGQLDSACSEISGNETPSSKMNDVGKSDESIIEFYKKRNCHLLANSCKEILVSKTPKRPQKQKVVADRFKKGLNQKENIISRKKKETPFLRTAPSSPDPVPSTSYASSSPCDKANEKVCSWYKMSYDDKGKPIFNKQYLKYFMTINSPDMTDLKNKRWNTSFLHETPRPKRDIQIFTPEEDNSPKWLENVPQIESELPDIPGTKFAHVFDDIPINDSDDEFEFSNLRKSLPRKRGRKDVGRKSLALPDESLSPFDYTGLFDSSSNCVLYRKSKACRDEGNAKLTSNTKVARNSKDAHCIENIKSTEDTKVVKNVDKGAKIAKNTKNAKVATDKKNTKRPTVTKSTKEAKNLKGTTADKVFCCRKRSHSSDSESLSCALRSSPIGYSNECLPMKESRKDEDKRLLQKFKNVRGNKQINIHIRMIPSELFSKGVTEIEIEGEKYTIKNAVS